MPVIKGERIMEHLNVAIADDNQKMLDMLEEIINTDKPETEKKCVRSSGISDPMLYFST